MQCCAIGNMTKDETTWVYHIAGMMLPAYIKNK